MSILLQEKRQNRGTRMSVLIGEAAEQDEAFWNNEVWAEDEEDESFQSEDEEVKPDEFDSDFNDTEDEGDESSDDDEDDKPKRKQTKSAYKEPGARPAKRKRAQADDASADDDDEEDDGEDTASKVPSPSKTEPKPPKPVVKRRKQDIPIPPSTRTIRDSTKIKTEVAEIMRESAANAKPKVKVRPPPKHLFSQMELLEEALETERTNMNWIESRKIADKDRAMQERMRSAPVASDDRGKIRYLSRRGTYDTITFTDDNTFNNLFPTTEPPAPRNKICAVTGKVARYICPKTGLPYHDLAAFKILRKRYAAKAGGKNFLQNKC